MIARILENDQVTIAGLSILIVVCILIGYWIRGAENASARQGEPEPTEHGKVPL
jgi:hypothetical protein